MLTNLMTSRSNPRVKQLRAALSGQARLSDGMIGIEGEHLLQEALHSGISLRTVFVSQHRSLPPWIPHDAEILWLTEQVFASSVETQSPQGLAALIVPPVWRLEDVLAREASPLVLVTCGLQDPGNLGTLIRSAEAFGATGILTSPGTVHPWNQKAVRSSAGSIFRMPVARATRDEVAGLRARGIRLLATTGADDAACPIQQVDLQSACALMIGNEGAGLTEEWMEIADALVTIPCPGPVESLNAAIAGSLLLYEASRQRENRIDNRTRSNP